MRQNNSNQIEGLTQEFPRLWAIRIEILLKTNSIFCNRRTLKKCLQLHLHSHVHLYYILKIITVQRTNYKIMSNRVICMRT